ncbi:MAG: FAD-dependent oxidoreductase, partial [Ruminococcus sp.]|nr:FAD-dependent oxidoreductase [Ruminococcus sp.]
ICGGQTKNTTAKITFQHADIYSSLIKTVGKNMAKEYYLYNKKAIEDFENIINRENISCSFERLPAAIYSCENNSLIETEARAADILGIENEVRKTSALPFEIKSSLIFPNQAQFDPLKFLKPLSEKLNIFENTPVMRIENNTVLTDRARIKADKIVFSCHYPFVNFPGLYFMRMHQERSYVVALEKAQSLDAMYYSVDKNGLSLRCAENKLLLGGGSHRTGKNEDGGKYLILENKAHELWHDCEVTAKWSAQDCITGDKIPFIGKFSKGKENWYIQTGYNKWGMTSSMVAAKLTAESIISNSSKITVFFPSRKVNMPSVKETLTDAAESIKGICERFCFSCDEIDDIQNGHAAICDIDGERKGVYKDELGELHIVSTRCPHLGCELKWNTDEKTWDCPCHGSRFSIDGELITEPAQIGLDDDME